MKAVFRHLKKYAPTINLNKCSFAKREAGLLGYLIGIYGAKVEIFQVKYIAEIPIQK